MKCHMASICTAHLQYHLTSTVVSDWHCQWHNLIQLNILVSSYLRYWSSPTRIHSSLSCLHSITVSGHTAMLHIQSQRNSLNWHFIFSCCQTCRTEYDPWYWMSWRLCWNICVLFEWFCQTTVRVKVYRPNCVVLS